MAGTVVTFYSFKGGVGRSFALANTAVLLARWGYRVLTIDWDLEAPGLHQYFGPLLADPPESGIVELVDDFAAGVEKPAADYVTVLETNEPGAVHLLAAGRQVPSYGGRVQSIDWAALYDNGFADLLERHRAEWVDAYDFVLIDSRTGFADIASMCTAHLPDRLVVVFTANEQSVRGAVDVAGRADAARDRMPYDRPQLTVLPILSRFDSRVEYERAETWYRICTDLTAPLFHNWLVKHVSEAQLLRHLTLPYVSYWSFGEQLPVLAEREPSANQIGFALETVAAVVAHGFDRTDLLADNRDAYVAAAQAPERGFDLDILVSSPRSALEVATALVDELRSLGVRAERSLSGDLDFLGKSLDAARHLCLMVEDHVSRWQEAEAERFLRHALTAGDRRLFPVLTRTADPALLPGFLRNLQLIRLDAGVRPRDVARRLHAQLSGNGHPPRADVALFRDAEAALRQVQDSRLHYSLWYFVEQTAKSMATALREGDTDSLREITLDLELASRVREAGTTYEKVAMPDRVAPLISEMIGKFGRRIKF
ncbi:MAG: CATRA system-associated protein [Actinophytocola sp.]|uniref:CATRA system-associated protein n=1 Tax=Actinophytocola sp. TaxID=1872138 RepID=UPI003D6A0C68